MFNPKVYDNRLQQWEHIPASTGVYKAGQALKMESGKLTAISGSALTTTPPYISMADKTVGIGGGELPVIRVTEDTIFETTLTKASVGAKAGAKLQVSDGGLGVDSTAAGTFELNMTPETTAGGETVYGRFVTAAAGA